VTDASALKNVVLNVQRDDGVVIYLNGKGIYTNNMPSSFDYLTPATATVGTTDETAFYSYPVSASLLLSGNNVLAAEIHQVTNTSSDIIFDFELTAEGFPANQSPVVNAGSDQSIILPGTVSLGGSVSDDGLPIPPGLLTFGWLKMSGPGTVSFANPNSLSTTASFSEAGVYGLRLTANDGAGQSSDDVTITVNGQTPPSFKIDGAQVIGGANPVFKLWFTTAAGISYSVQYRDAVTSGGQWQKLSNVPAGSAQQVEITDNTISNSATRFYRIVSPQQP
jgi:hypothetical protein